MEKVKERERERERKRERGCDPEACVVCIANPWLVTNCDWFAVKREPEPFPWRSSGFILRLLIKPSRSNLIHSERIPRAFYFLFFTVKLFFFLLII